MCLLCIEFCITIGVIFAVNLPEAKGGHMFYYILHGGYISFMLIGYLLPYLVIGNEKETYLYKLLRYVPVKRKDIFKSGVIIVVKLISVRIAGILILGILYCMPYKRVWKI